MRNKIAVLAATVLLAGGALATASSASANEAPPGGGGWDHIWFTSDANSGGTLYVEEHGDIVQLCDSAADGYAPRASISDGTPQGTYTIVGAGGFGACTTVMASDGAPYDLPESQRIDVSIWLGPTPVKGSETDTYFINDH